MSVFRNFSIRALRTFLALASRLTPSWASNSSRICSGQSGHSEMLLASSPRKCTTIHVAPPLNCFSQWRHCIVGSPLGWRMQTSTCVQASSLARAAGFRFTMAWSGAPAKRNCCCSLLRRFKIPSRHPPTSSQEENWMTHVFS